MYKVIGWGACLLLSGFLAGCPQLTKSTSNNMEALSVEDFSIETDQLVYMAEEGDSPLEISYSYVNESKQSFYPGSCLGVASDMLEKRVDGEWVLAYDPICPDVLRPPIEVEAGARYDAKIQLTPSTWEQSNSFWKGGDIEGVYRLRERVYGEWDMEKFDKGTLPSKIVVSNEFEIQKAP